jgi:hypothetical protein
MGLVFPKNKAAVAQSSNGENGEAPAKTGGISFLMKGAAAKVAVAQEEAKAEARKKNGAFPFSLKYNEDGQITFLDGSLDEDGILDVNRWFQHRIPVGQRYESYVCTANIDKTQPCPICETGDRPSLVGVLTVIDHRKIVIQKGPNAGKTLTNVIRPFIAKDGTLKQLNKLAQKPERNGLRFCTFDVSRGPDNKHPPQVGDTFDFVTKRRSPRSTTSSPRT